MRMRCRVIACSYLRQPNLNGAQQQRELPLLVPPAQRCGFHWVGRGTRWARHTDAHALNMQLASQFMLLHVAAHPEPMRLAAVLMAMPPVMLRQSKGAHAHAVINNVATTHGWMEC